jgi:hypothetical protein
MNIVRTISQVVEKVTGCVSCGGWERGFAAETDKSLKSRKCPKKRRVRTVTCALCWAVILAKKRASELQLSIVQIGDDYFRRSSSAISKAKPASYIFVSCP